MRWAEVPGKFATNINEVYLERGCTDLRDRDH